ncbi:MAG: nitroreductase family protein, partial [Peptostreptococcaceae bacterium]
MSDLINMILERRTIRRYKDEMIKDDELEKIIQAGLWAPSAGGRQSPIMLVCKNKEVNEELGCINRKVFGPARSDEVNYVSKTQKSIADDD